MKNLFFHIGLEKTGTTSLEAFFTLNQDVLRRHGMLYPQTGRLPVGSGDHTAHHLLGLHFLDNVGYPHLPRAPRNIVPELKKEIARNEVSNILISSEVFITLPQTQMAKLHDAFREYNVTIIIFLRRQDDYFLSQYSQFIKHTRYNGRKICPPEEFDCPRIAFWDLLETWAAEFGADAIKVVPFEKQQMPGGLYGTMLTTLGMELTDEYAIPDIPKNIRLSPEMIEYLLLVNPRVSSAKARKTLGQAVHQYWTSRSQADQTASVHDCLPGTFRRDLLNRFADDNRRIAVKYLARESGQLFLDTIVHESSSPDKAAISVEEMAMITAGVLDTVAEIDEEQARRLKQKYEHSLSWKIAAPLRAGSRLLKRLAKPHRG
jgi:hypothetical protein